MLFLQQNETAEDIARRKSHSEILEILKNTTSTTKKIVTACVEPTKPETKKVVRLNFFKSH